MAPDRAGRIVLAGTFDTKSEPLNLLIGMLRERGEDPVSIDTSVYPAESGATHQAEAVAARAGRNHADLPALGRAEAVRAMSEGAAEILRELQAKREAGALVCMGGSNAATVFSRLAPVLPLGVPKLLMSTGVAGETRPIMGAADAILLYPVVDVDGGNRILRRMIRRLAETAAALKCAKPLGEEASERKSVALTMYGVTTPCVQRVSALVEESGMEPFVFHANGTGGRSVEDFAVQGIVDGVVDATLAELGNELLGGAFPAGPDRMTGAARSGVPQVIAPGAIDMIAFGARSTVPARLEDHKIVAHNELVTLVRTTPDECHAIGARLADRLGTPKARTAVCIPLGGTSMLDKEGATFRDPDAVLAFRNGLRESASPEIEIIESDCNINDPAFADLLFKQLNAAMSDA